MEASAKIVSLCLGLSLVGAAYGQGACIRVEAGKPLMQEPDGKFLPPRGATRLVIHLPGANVDVPGEVIADVPGGTAMRPLIDYIPPRTFIDKASTALAERTTDRSRMRIAYVDAANKLQTFNSGTPFFLANSESEEAAKRVACGGIANPENKDILAEPAQPAYCKQIAVSHDYDKKPYEAWILFNSTGAVCYAPYPLRQRDRIYFSMVWMQGEEVLSGASANITNCARPSPAPSIYTSGELPSRLIFHKGRVLADRRKVTALYEVQEIAAPVECSSGDPHVAVTIPAKDASATTRTHTLNLWERWTAAFHVGALNSRLRETDFGLQTVGGQTTIVNREAKDRGPEYVATIVVQALPRYFTSEKGLAYPGRDLLHDNDTQDRIGLAFAFGLRDPGKRFGVGLTFEVVRGVNLIVAHEWIKRDQLSGVNEGDTFTGTADQLPKRREWDSGTSIGLTFDIAYVTRIFGGGK